jgi:hypothetical protein
MIWGENLLWLRYLRGEAEVRSTRKNRCPVYGADAPVDNL